MRIEFFTPPAAQRRGGIDLAIDGIRGAVCNHHRVVSKETGSPDPETQLVHFHGLWQANHLRAYRRCRRHGIPYIVSPHGMLEPWAYRHRRWKKWPWLKLFGQAQLDHSACVLATSQLESGNLRPFTDGIEVAPLGLSETPPMTRQAAREALGLTPSDKVVLYLSRVDRKKGLDMLIPAMSAHADWELWITGDGDPDFTAELKRLSNQRVRWFPPAWGGERWKYLLAADLFCLPTHSENFGFAILEAMWAGTPTLTTNKTPWAEHEGVDGLFICDDTTSSVRGALGKILPTLTRPTGLSEWARSKYHWDNLANTYDAIYHRVALQA